MNNYSKLVLSAFLSQQEALKLDNDKHIDSLILSPLELNLAREKKEVIEENIKDIVESLEILEKHYLE